MARKCISPIPRTRAGCPQCSGHQPGTGPDTGAQGKVAVLTGMPGALNLEERRRGFQDEIAEKYPDIEIVATVAGYDDINRSVQAVEETMQAYPGLDGWFFVGLWPLFAERGSMPLWEEAARSGRVRTVAFDTLPRPCRPLSTASVP